MSLAVLEDGGELGARMRAVDWAASPLDAVERWPAPLQTLVRVMLSSRQPMFIAWGPERILLYNDHYAPMLGARDATALGRPFFEVWPEIRGPVGALMDQVFAGEPVHMDDLALTLLRNGAPEEAHFAFSYTPVPGADGVIAGLFCACTETTRQVLAERRLKTRLLLEERLRQVTDTGELSFTASELLAETLGAARAGYGTVDHDAQTITVERNWSAPGFSGVAGVHQFRTFGAYIDDLARGVPVAVSDVRSDPRTAGSVAAFEALGIGAFVDVPVLEQGRLAAEIFVHAATPRVWTEEEVVLVRDFADRTRSAIARREAENRLRDLNADLERQVAERSRERDRAWALTRDIQIVIDHDGTVLAANPAFESLLGWAHAEVIGRPVFDFVFADDHAMTTAALVQARGQPLPIVENRYRHKAGGVRWLSWVAAPEGSQIYASGRDITVEREQAEALRQSQKMEAVGQLTGGLAHDFNNLLAGISGSLELIRTRLAQGRSADVERYATAAQGATNRTASLTHRLLAFSRRQTLAPKPTDVKGLVSGMADLIGRTIGPAIRLETINAAGLWPSLIDPSQLENAVLNLCINARDAMPDGGTITIETGNRWLDRHAADERGVEPGQYISLCVSDTGTGMTPDVIAKAFDPFFTTKPIGVGTGLGLSMIYGFAKQSGGAVSIYSEPGHGAMVCIYLPRHLGATADEGATPELVELPRGIDGETVLVVDDEPTVRMLVAEVLADLGYIAIEAEDGAAGLKVINSPARVDLLVTDVGLPGGMNGRQVADAARAVRPGLKVLFITGYAENAVLSHGHLDPGMHVMTKPFAMEALATRIRELIER